VTDERPGRTAGELVSEAKAVLADPAKAAYHERLRTAVEKLEGVTDFWDQLNAVVELVAVANERVPEDCPHDSLSGDEGPVELLGRMPIRWRCDACDAIIDDCGCE